MPPPRLFPQSTSCYIYPHEEDSCCCALGPRVRRSGVRGNYASPPSPSSPPSQSLVRRRPSLHGGRRLRVRNPNDWPSFGAGQSRSLLGFALGPPWTGLPTYLITSFGPVTSGTIALPVLVLHSCHEEICGCRAVAGVVCRPGLCHVAFSQKAPQGPAYRGTSQGLSPDK